MKKCKFQAPTKSRLINHRKTHEHQSLFCTLCDFKTSFEKSLDVHKIRVHNGYGCEICDRKFTTNNSLRQHQLNNHEPIKCENCEFIASTRKNMLVHNKSCYLALRCYVCNRRFLKLNALNKHKLRHEELKCNVCGVYWLKKKDLEKHNAFKHIFRKCENCDFEGANKQINAHHKTFHKIKAHNSIIQTEINNLDLRKRRKKKKKISFGKNQEIQEKNMY